MIQAIQKIERSIRERRINDVNFVNYWLYIFILNPITFGIYSIILYFKRINRVDRFLKRKNAFFQGVNEYTEKYAKENGKYELVANEIDDLKNFYRQQFFYKIKKIDAGVAFLLTLITAGIWAFVVLYKLNKFWFEAQIFEQDYYDRLSKIWLKLELSKYPINYEVDISKNRNYAVYLLLTVVTLGIWGIVWDYKLHTDPENIFSEIHAAEDFILQVVRG